MREQDPKSSALSTQPQKLHVDLRREIDVAVCMEYQDDIQPIKVRTGVFAIITARLEDMHEIAIAGQSARLDADEVAKCVLDLESQLEEVEILLSAVHVMTR